MFFNGSGPVAQTKNVATLAKVFEPVFYSKYVIKSLMSCYLIACRYLSDSVHVS